MPLFWTLENKQERHRFMTRRRPDNTMSLASIYLKSVSYGALSLALSRREPELPVAALGLLARIGVWLRLIFDDVFAKPIAICVDTHASAAPLNRTLRRRKRRSLPLARRADRLAEVILRRFGYGRYLEWIYNRTLTPRVRWCFFSWNWAWSPRRWFLGCEEVLKTALLCHAPLRPD